MAMGCSYSDFNHTMIKLRIGQLTIDLNKQPCWDLINDHCNFCMSEANHGTVGLNELLITCLRQTYEQLNYATLDRQCKSNTIRLHDLICRLNYSDLKLTTYELDF